MNKESTTSPTCLHPIVTHDHIHYLLPRWPQQLSKWLPCLWSSSLWCTLQTTARVISRSLSDHVPPCQWPSVAPMDIVKHADTFEILHNMTTANHSYLLMNSLVKVDPLSFLQTSPMCVCVFFFSISTFAVFPPSAPNMKNPFPTSHLSQFFHHSSTILLVVEESAILFECFFWALDTPFFWVFLTLLWHW